MKIKEEFKGACVNKTVKNQSYFQGLNLPGFVKDYIIRRFSDEEGVIDEIYLKEYLQTKIPQNDNRIKSRLINGAQINITTRIVFKTNLKDGSVEFELPDAGITSDALVSSALISKSSDNIFDGEQWGNVTISYHAPEKRQKGFVMMTSFKPFAPYTVDLDYFRKARKSFSLEEWIDFLINVMGYDVSKMSDSNAKLEYITRMLPFVEPRFNLIELGPKSTGKSHLYNNLSKYGWCISGGKISRAKLFYNKSNRQFGLLKHYDVVSIDEISSFSFVDPDEMQTAFKNYLEDGKCTVDNNIIQSECGLTLMGNIPLDDERNPLDNAYHHALPRVLQESATLDRFHSFIEGWKLPRLEAGFIYEGWTLDAEYFSSVLHALRSEGDYLSLFDDLVEYEEGTDLRDLKAVKKVATAYAKLLFPHVKRLSQLTEEAQLQFAQAYDRYCLQPAIRRRGIIRNLCHSIDKEFHKDMPNFKIKLMKEEIPE